MSYNWHISKNLQLAPFVNYTLTDDSFVEFIDEDEDFSGNQLTGVPRQRSTIGIQSRIFENFYWNITHQHVSKIPLNNAANLFSDPFTVYNSRMGYQKKLSDQFTLGFDLGVNNLFDKVYAQSVLINAQGFGGNEPRFFNPGDARNYYGSIRLGYKL